LKIQEILEIMAYNAEPTQHYESAKKWKEATGGKVVGIEPMHFPAEIYHAASALPVLLQEGPEAVTLGHSYMLTYYCGYSRSLADSAAKGDLDFMDAFIIGRGASSVQGLCVQDVFLQLFPDKLVDTTEIIEFMDDPWSKERVIKTFTMLKEHVESLTGVTVTKEKLLSSIRLYNRGRELMRELYQLRRDGNDTLNPVQMQNIIKASMVMPKEEHNSLLEQLVPLVKATPKSKRSGKIPVYLSGHLCHIVKPDILRLIVENGGVVVDDDLYTGWRYIFNTIKENNENPIEALADDYFDKNKILPCPTRIDPHTNWNLTLLDNVRKSGAKGLIILQVKYCEPHMFNYPDIKDTFEKTNIPHLLLETEHEVISMESLRTRIESFMEKINIS